MQWYYAINDQRQGPVSHEEFERLVREGVIGPETLVWRQGMQSWQPYRQIAATLVMPPLPAVDAAGAPIPDDTAVCAVSGKRYPKREMIQYEGQWISAEHRDAFFQRIREGATQAGEVHYAGFWIRFVAWIIDWVVMFVVANVVNLLFGVGWFGRNVNYAEPDFLPTFFLRIGLALLTNEAIHLAYNWFFIRRFAATPGKMALGLKIVRSDGTALSTGRIIGRHFAEKISMLIMAIGYIIAAFNDEKQALHDLICDTRVIKGK